MTEYRVLRNKLNQSIVNILSTFPDSRHILLNEMIKSNLSIYAKPSLRDIEARIIDKRLKNNDVTSQIEKTIHFTKGIILSEIGGELIKWGISNEFIGSKNKDDNPSFIELALNIIYFDQYRETM